MATERRVIVDTDSSATSDYDSLDAAIAGEQKDLVDLDRKLVIELRASAGDADVGEVGVTTDWVTSATNTLTIEVAAGHRHQGVWDDTKYRLVSGDNNGAAAGRLLRVDSDNVVIDGLQLENNDSVYDQYIICLLINGSACRARNILMRDLRTDATHHRIGMHLSGDDVRAENCVAYGFRAASGTTGYCAGFYRDDAGTAEFDNCTAYDCRRGFHAYGTDAVLKLRNCAAVGNTLDGDYVTTDGAFDAECSHNASSDTSAPGSDSLTGLTASDTFEDAAAGDFRLKDGSAAIDAGTDLSSLFTTDITGATRDVPFDIGAFEYSGVPPASRVQYGSDRIDDTTDEFSVTLPDPIEAGQLLVVHMGHRTSPAEDSYVDGDGWELGFRFHSMEGDAMARTAIAMHWKVAGENESQTITGGWSVGQSGFATVEVYDVPGKLTFLAADTAGDVDYGVTSLTVSPSGTFSSGRKLALLGACFRGDSDVADLSASGFSNLLYRVAADLGPGMESGSLFSEYEDETGPFSADLTWSATDMTGCAGMMVFAVTAEFLAREDSTNVLCLGDSVTAGYDDSHAGNSYRWPLYQRLVDNGGYGTGPAQLAFVGPMYGVHTSNMEPSVGWSAWPQGDSKHAGYGGETVAQLASRVNGLVTDHDPNVILCMAGFNATEDVTAQDYRDLIDNARAAKADIKIVFAKIYYNASPDADTDAANAALATAVGEKNSETSPLVIVDMNEGWDPAVHAGGTDGTYGDNYPSPDGNALLADRFAEALYDEFWIGPGQYARPVADAEHGGWVPSEGDALYPMLNTQVADDSTRITSMTPGVARMLLSPALLPADVGKSLSYRVRGTGRLKVRLYQGDTLIAEREHASLDGENFTLLQMELTEDEKNALVIGDPLSVELESLES